MAIREQDSRTAMLLGEDGVQRLREARVAVFGVGGVGSYVCEALARAGVGALDLIDSDTVSLSNLNRQLVALHSTLGHPKVDVMAERIRDINPDCHVRAIQRFYLPDSAADFDLSSYDYIADCIDTVSAKIDLAVRAHEGGIPIIAAMGAGNKLDACAFEVADLAKTTVCPLARVMRLELRRRGITHMKVVYSKEPPRKGAMQAPPDEGSRIPPASISYAPAVAGLLLAGEIIRDIAGIQE